MSKLFWSTWILYLTAAGGYSGWRGRDLWSDWGVWYLLLPPLALAAFTSLRSWRSGVHVQAAVIMSVFAVVAIGGSVLGLAWGIAEATRRGQSMPPIDVYRIGDLHFVRDGHHRISVAAACGAREIDALVTVWEVEGALP